MNSLQRTRVRRSCRVAVIGAGPAGLFAAYRLADRFTDPENVLVIEKGKDIQRRSCDARCGRCADCLDCEMISGLGGSGLFSDGKFSLDLNAGGHLTELIPPVVLCHLLSQTTAVIEKFSQSFVSDKPTTDPDVTEHFRQRGLGLKRCNVYHFGSDNLHQLTSDITKELKNRHVSFLLETRITKVTLSGSSHKWLIGFTDAAGDGLVEADYLVAAVGKEGNFWLSEIIEALGGHAVENSTYIGVRMEFSSANLKAFLAVGRDPRISFDSDGTRIKTHCFCRYGQILLTKYFGLPLVGGHSPRIELDPYYGDEVYPNSNIAILYRNKDICTREAALATMAKISAMTRGALLTQRLKDFLDGCSTTPAQLATNSIVPSNCNVFPGSIDDNVLPGFRAPFLLFLERLADAFPDMMSPDNLLYAPAVEWWMRRISVSSSMRVDQLPNFYAIGDGSGWTQGIVQSAATGLVAALDILQREGAIERTH